MCPSEIILTFGLHKQFCRCLVVSQENLSYLLHQLWETILVFKSISKMIEAINVAEVKKTEKARCSRFPSEKNCPHLAYENSCCKETIN